MNATQTIKSFNDAAKQLESTILSMKLDVHVSVSEYTVSLFSENAADLEVAAAMCFSGAKKAYAGATEARRMIEGAHVALIQYRARPEGRASRR